MNVGSREGSGNPITKEEMDNFKKSVHIGDRVKYSEKVPRDDGTGGLMVVKTEMEINGIYRNFVTLKAGKMQRSLTWPELLISKKPGRSVSQNRKAKIDEKERSRIIMELYNSGMRRMKIAEETGYSYSTVTRVINLHTKKHKVNHPEIIRMRKKGLTLKEISKMTGASETTVQRICRHELIKENAGLEENGNELFKVCAPGPEPEKPGRRVL